jgi:uncharacterized protein with GYD domain
MLTNLTDDGRKTVNNNPDRIAQVNREVEEMGVKIVAQYALLGSHDFVTFIDSPDRQTVIKVAMDLGARGTMHTTTMSAMTIDEFVEAMT